MKSWKKVLLTGTGVCVLLTGGYGYREFGMVKAETKAGTESLDHGSIQGEASLEDLQEQGTSEEDFKAEEEGGENVGPGVSGSGETEPERETERKVGPGVANEPETEEEPELESVTISLAGDCSIGTLSIHGYEGTFREMYDKYGPSYFFKNVKSVFEADDMTLVNFEGVLTNSNKKVPKEFNIKGTPEYIQVLPEGDIDAVSFGNNHRIDYGDQGIADTITAFNSIGMPYAYDENIGIFETERGVKIGFVSVDVVYGGRQVENYLQSGFERLRQENVNLILACCHWGIESTYYPESYQLELGHKCIDWGADLVVGCHPHVLQGVEKYKGKYILYSLGNFCFGGNRNPKDKNTMIAQAKFTLEEGSPKGEAEMTLIPCTISSVNHRNDYCPTIAQGEKRTEIIQKLNGYSSQFGVTVGEDGKVSGPEEAKEQPKETQGETETAETSAEGSGE